MDWKLFDMKPEHIKKHVDHIDLNFQNYPLIIKDRQKKKLSNLLTEEKWQFINDLFFSIIRHLKHVAVYLTP